MGFYIHSCPKMRYKVCKDKLEGFAVYILWWFNVSDSCVVRDACGMRDLRNVHDFYDTFKSRYTQQWSGGEFFFLS